MGMAAGLGGGTRMLGFRVGDAHFAMPAADVREVVRRPRLTRVPHAPVSLLGLGNLRGSVLPLIALGALIDRAVTDAGRVIVLERADPVGLLVDDITGMTQGGDLPVLDIDALLGARFVGTAQGAQRQGAVGGARPDEDAGEDIVLLSFAAGDQDYALPITQIEEVIRLPAAITRLPESDAVVIGTVERAGGLLPLLSLQHLLGLGGAVQDRRRVVIVRVGTRSVGLVVDQIRSVLRVDEQHIDAVPEVLTRGRAEARIQAICRVDGGRHLVSILAADHLLRADLTARLLQDKSEKSESMAQQHTDDDQVLVFQLGGQDFGLPIAVVDEVTAMPAKITRLPRAPDFVLGVMNLRGDVIALIDQRRRFHGEAAAGQRRRVIVVTLGPLRVGFVVDAVSEVLRVPASAIRTAPGLGDERMRVFDRIATLDAELGDAARMILMVDPQELLDRAERDLVAALSENDTHP